jgi:hypothetical protein
MPGASPPPPLSKATMGAFKNKTPLDTDADFSFIVLFSSGYHFVDDGYAYYVWSFSARCSFQGDWKTRPGRKPPDFRPCPNDFIDLNQSITVRISFVHCTTTQFFSFARIARMEGQSHEVEAFLESLCSPFGYQCEINAPVDPPYIPQTYNSTFHQPHLEPSQQTDHQCPLCGNHFDPNVSPATYRPEVNLEPNLSDVESLLSILTQDGHVLPSTSPLHQLSEIPQSLGDVRLQQQLRGLPEELLDVPTFPKANYVSTCVSPGFPIHSGHDADWQNALRAANSFPALCTDPTLLWNCDQRFALQIDTSGTMSSPSDLGGYYVPPPSLISPSSSEFSTTVLAPTTLQQHQATSIQPQRILPRSARASSPLSTYTYSPDLK